MMKAPKKRRTSAAAVGIAPAVHVPRAFAELAQGDPVVLNQVVNAFEQIIKASFQTNPVLSGNPTAGHVRERFQVLERWFRTLRAEQKWGVTRILDNLKDALHAELNGNTWTPDTRKCWMPGDGT